MTTNEAPHTTSQFLTGVFAGPVSGLKYETPTAQGITNERGEFTYRDGETVSFKVGRWVLGAAVGAPRITLADLANRVAGQIDKLHDASVTNAARLLQSLDEDGDLENGLTIAPAAHDLFTFGTLNFDQMFSKVPAEEAFTADPMIVGLLDQLNAGADALQIFDTWAGVLPPREFHRWSIEPAKRIVAGVRKVVPDAKIIGFPRGAGALLPAYVEATGVDAVSIDWAAEPALIRERVQSKVAVQGNLDPLALIAGGDALERAVDQVLHDYGEGRLIFNLGHGIQPETPIAHVEQMLRRVRERPA